VRKIVFYLVFAYLALFISGCCTRRGTLVSNIGDGIAEYGELQAELRAGETELAVTGTKIESESRELGNGIRELEQSIISREGASEEIGAILERIRSREVSPDIIERWRNSQIETGEGES